MQFDLVRTRSSVSSRVQQVNESGTALSVTTYLCSIDLFRSSHVGHKSQRQHGLMYELNATTKCYTSARAHT